MAPIMKRVEIDGHDVVVASLLALRHVCAHTAGQIVTDEHDIQVGVIVRQIRRCPMADGLAVAWLALPELCHQGLRFAGRTAQEVLQLRRARHLGNPQTIVFDELGSVGGRGWDSAADLRGSVDGRPRWSDTGKGNDGSRKLAHHEPSSARFSTRRGARCRWRQGYFVRLGPVSTGRTSEGVEKRTCPKPRR